MPVQENMCGWPSCFATRTLLPMVGLDGCIHLACPFHHEWILRDMHQHRWELAHMPIQERTTPTTFDPLSNPFTAWCQKPDCWFRVAQPTYEEAVRVLAIHKCPYASPSRGLIVSMTVAQKMWEKYDAAIAELMEGTYPNVPLSDGSSGEHPEKVRLKGVCRGMAEMLAEMMAPHLKTPDEIVGEGMRRYKAKKAGEPYETPGLVRPPIATPRLLADKQANNKLGPKQPVSVPAKPAHKFTEEEVGSIKFAAESGMFTTEQLAKTYKVTVDAIAAVIAS